MQQESLGRNVSPPHGLTINRIKVRNKDWYEHNPAQDLHNTPEEYRAINTSLTVEICQGSYYIHARMKQTLRMSHRSLTSDEFRLDIFW